MRVFLNVTNIGLSDFNSVPEAVRKPGANSLIQTGDWIFQEAWAQIDSDQAGSGGQIDASKANATANQMATTQIEIEQPKQANQTESAPQGANQQ